MKPQTQMTWPGPNADRVMLAAALAWIAWNDPSRPITPPPLNSSAFSALEAWQHALGQRRDAEARIFAEITAAARQLLPVLHRVEPCGERWIAGSLRADAQFDDMDRIPGEQFYSEVTLVDETMFVEGGGPWIAIGRKGNRAVWYANVTIDRGLLLAAYPAASAAVIDRAPVGAAKMNLGGRPQRADRRSTPEADATR